MPGKGALSSVELVWWCVEKYCDVNNRLINHLKQDYNEILTFTLLSDLLRAPPRFLARAAIVKSFKFNICWLLLSNHLHLLNNSSQPSIQSGYSLPGLQSDPALAADFKHNRARSTRQLIQFSILIASRRNKKSLKNNSGKAVKIKPENWKYLWNLVL